MREQLDRNDTRLICVHDSVAAYSHLTQNGNAGSLTAWAGESSRQPTFDGGFWHLRARRRASAGQGFTFPPIPVSKLMSDSWIMWLARSHGVSVPRLITSDRRGGRGLRLSRGTLMTVALTRSTLPMTDLTTLVRTVATSPELW